MTNLRKQGSTFGKGDRYVISSVLHNGTFSQVYGVSDAKNGKLVALKEDRKSTRLNSSHRL